MLTLNSFFLARDQFPLPRLQYRYSQRQFC
ncbi:hypothetical protein NIES970_07100 [[Synechococcus] sp. NIES-970]|nr:hypothetical protein NIES970_07100 [[Synechococcus] sp. NIES-970]